MAAPPVPAATPRDPLVRPLLWRLPLLVVVVVGLLSLRYLDALLQREYRTEATTQAVQTNALLESFIRQRVSLLHSLEVLLGNVGGRIPDRFPHLAREVFADAPDVRAITYLDPSGEVRAVYRRAEVRVPVVGSNERSDPARAVAIQRALRTGEVTVAPSVRLRDGHLGIVIYEPVVDRGTVTGLVAGSFSYGSLFNDALAGQLQGHFAYRLRDEAGQVIATSPEYPESVASLVTREVSLPGGRAWQLDVAIPRFQPFTPRVILWTVGLLLIAMVVFLVVREEQRAERIAAHSFHLELLSRDLLDANMRLEERAQQVAEANRAKSRFLANVSHELRTPLNAIVGYNGLALDGVYGELPPELAEAHRRVGKAAEHLLALVNDVLDLAKIEVGRMQPDLEPVDVRALVDGVVTVIEPIASAKDVRIDVVLARDLPRLTTDPRHLRQILLNLASNAVKFTERGSVAIIARRSADDPERRITITVEDTGIGIAENDLDRIFEEFEQVRPSGRGDSQERGTGLGLAIARKLARVLGGDVRVESRLGQGSRFTVVLPIVSVAAPPPELESTSSALTERAIEELGPPARRSHGDGQARIPAQSSLAEPPTHDDEPPADGAATIAHRASRGLDDRSLRD